MKIIADQIFATLGFPWDSKLINLVLDGNIATVETISQYLARVDINSRYLGLSPIVLSPAGTYEINVFLAGLKDGTFTRKQYIFDLTIEDIGLVEILNTKISDEAPINPEQGDSWFNTLIGSLFIWIVDNDLSGQWVEAVPGGKDGSDGAQGIQGAIGIGSQGTIGESIQGSQGIIGTSVQGSVGISIQGAIGSQGEIGESIQGSAGYIGEDGTQGVQGTDGAQGIQGVQGPAGEGGGGGVVDTTYADLVTAINSSLLVPGQSYKLTDFATKHYIPDGGGDICLDANLVPYVNTGTVEPLIVDAIDYNKLSPVAYSTLYPQDILHYDWNPNNWLLDLAISAHDEAVLSGFKGVIHYREDTKNKNILGYDFRSVKNRRWKFNYPIWDGVTTYNLKTKVQVPGDGAYISIQFDNLNHAVTDAAWWMKIIDYSNYGDYWCANISETSDESDFVDLLTFVEGTGTATYEVCVKQNTFSPFNDTTEEEWGCSASLLDGNVFYLPDEGNYTVLNNKFGAWFQYNTIDGKYFEENTIGNFNYYNTFGNNNYYNILGNDNHHNTFGNDNKYNTFGNYNYSNTFGNDNTSNTFGNSNINNTFTGISIRRNIFKDSINGNGVDYSSSTHLVNDYTCEIVKTSTGTFKLKYLDGTDNTEKIVNINS